MSLPFCRPFKSVLIANRGEIAVRIVREAQAAGLRAVAVYSDADKNALQVQQADAAVHIGASPARESYLNVEKILAAAKQTGAEAIHPGYGFLSENADFAQSVIDAGLVWIGPSPDAIRAMGDKGAAKQIARKADVPVIPGYDGDNQSDAHLLAEAKKIGWPVLIKAANGGGGRGQRRVTSEAEFAEALASARRESLSAFASDRMILERALENVRHVEVQVFGDAHGNIIHLGERDCSVQRRNQKIIEEAPAPGVSEDLRSRMGDAAVRLARAVNYTNAGTVEFLLRPDGEFYFLEMNTRIQVEHPVTEVVTGTNLIQWQFDVSMGRPLPFKQVDIRIDGCAIEARLCTEDPGDDFRPQHGTIRYFSTWGLDSRLDAAINSGGGEISTHYDSLLAKVISKGATRDQALKTLVSDLKNLFNGPVRTNRLHLIRTLTEPEFVRGGVPISWLQNQPPFRDNNLQSTVGALAALYLACARGSMWSSTGVRRVSIKLRERDEERDFTVENNAIDGMTLVSVGTNPKGWGGSISAQTPEGQVHASVDTRGGVQVTIERWKIVALFEDITYAPAEPKDAAGDGAVRAPMAGKIVRVNAEAGAQIEKGQVLVILEAMKMEHEIVARGPGTVATVTAKAGDQVANRQVLVTITA